MSERMSSNFAPYKPLRKKLKSARTGDECNFVAPVEASISKAMDENEDQEVIWKRKEYGIQVEGKNCPPLVLSFDKMGLPTTALDVLTRRGIQTPTPIQMQAIPSILNGRDIVGIAQTGSGKTLAYVLPMLAMLEQKKKSIHHYIPNNIRASPLALILVPTRELMEQVFNECKSFLIFLSTSSYKDDPFIASGQNFSLVGICGGGVSTTNMTTSFMRMVEVMVATPGRLLHFLLQELVDLSNLCYLVIDEVDRMLESEMEVQVRGILEKANAFGRQTLLFSATLPHFLQRLVRSAVLNPIILHTIGKNKKMQQDFGGLLTLPTSCVKQTLLYMKQFEKKNKLLQILRNNIPFPPVLIFCNAIETVDFVTHLLHMEQFHVASFHGQKPQTYRFQVLQALREGFVDILVATDLASRGLNLPIEMNHIILYDLPLTIEDYIHRCGRIGRQGIQGQVYGFLTNQCTIAKELKQVLEENQQKVPLELQTLHRFASF